MLSNKEVDAIIQVCNRASEAILEVYYQENSNHFEVKFDDTPLTEADKRSNKIIVEALANITPHIPIISEENKYIDYQVRKNWQTFWLVDPLDGTKEFIKKSGEFTINIGLIHQGNPIAGFIHVPVSGVMYYAHNRQSFVISEKNARPQKIEVDRQRSKTWIAVGSRSHAEENEKNFLASYPIEKFITVGSSLKFCLIASGVADIYYRAGPTMEWDTAAGHALVLSAGGKVHGLEYNKPDLRNAAFYCIKQ